MADTINSVDLPNVHGMVALNPDGTAIGTPVGGATSANQTNGTQKTQIVDAGGEAVTVTGGKLDVNATASLAGQSIPATGATEAVTVQIVDGSGNQVASFGGGTQYTEGDTDASITGTALMFETNTGTNAIGVVNASNPLPVSASIDTTGLATTTTDTNTTTIAGDTTSIDAKIPALGQALAAASVPVILPAATITTLTPPAAITGFGTAANQTTIIGHLDGVEGLLTTIDGDTGTIATEVAGLLTDTELRATPVPVSGSLTVDLGANNDVTVTSGAITETNSGAIKTSVELIDDAIYTDGAGTPSKAIAIAGTDGTNPQIVKTDAAGELQVDVLSMPSTTVTATDLDIRNLANTDVVTAELSAVDNAVLDTIDAVLDTIKTDTASIVTSVGTLDNAISGSEMQVDVVAALPAGTNTIGAVKSVPSDIDINGSNANHADKYYTNAGAVTDGIVWSPAAGKRWHVLTLYINVSAAATVTLEDDLAGGDVARWKGELAANSGVVLKYDKEHPFSSGEDAADLIITTTAGNVYVQAVGYEV